MMSRFSLQYPMTVVLGLCIALCVVRPELEITIVSSLLPNTRYVTLESSDGRWHMAYVVFAPYKLIIYRTGSGKCGVSPFQHYTQQPPQPIHLLLAFYHGSHNRILGHRLTLVLCGTTTSPSRCGAIQCVEDSW